MAASPIGETQAPTLPAYVTVPLMLLGGAFVALQSRVNGALAGEIGDGLRAGALAAVISFGSGLVILTLAVASGRRRRAGVARLGTALKERRLRPVEMLGGLCGAFFVASQGIAVGVIGVALFIVAFTAGQSLASLVVDHVGLGPAGPTAVSVPRTIAAAFAIGAVLLKVAEQLDDAELGVALLLVLLALAAGVLQAVQQALNGRVSAVGGPLATTWNNFVVGTCGLLVLLAVSFASDGEIGALPTTWWYYVGGLLGIGFIAIASTTVALHGVLVLGLCMIAGQVVTAEIIEVLDPDVEVGLLGVLGALLAVVGVVVALAVRSRPEVPDTV